MIEFYGNSRYPPPDILYTNFSYTDDVYMFMFIIYEYLPHTISSPNGLFLNYIEGYPYLFMFFPCFSLS